MNISAGFTRSLLGSALLLLSASELSATTLTGQIGVQVAIGSACTIGNGSSTNGVNSWGTMDFGTLGDLNMAVDSSLIGADGTNALTITCSTGISPKLSLNAGANAGSSGVRYMANGATKIGYRLYSDSSRTTLFDIDTPLSLASGSQNIPIYGRILPGDQSSTTPASGIYKDTVIATLTW